MVYAIKQWGAPGRQHEITSLSGYLARNGLHRYDCSPRVWQMFEGRDRIGITNFNRREPIGPLSRMEQVIYNEISKIPGVRVFANAPLVMYNTTEKHLCTVHPDFLVVEPRTGSRLAIEYFGMVHDEKKRREYAGKCVLYQLNAIPLCPVLPTIHSNSSDDTIRSDIRRLLRGGL